MCAARDSNPPLPWQPSSRYADPRLAAALADNPAAVLLAEINGSALLAFARQRGRGLTSAGVVRAGAVRSLLRHVDALGSGSTRET